MFFTVDPVRAVHVKYAYLYACELMRVNLTHLEQQVICLHCGLVGLGKPVGFAKIAEWFGLSDGYEAECVYLSAVVKLREAIPGSALENWITGYRRTYHPNSRAEFRVDPMMPVPVWDGRGRLDVRRDAVTF